VEVLLDFISNLSDPDWIVANGGLYLLLFIVFAETGILIGFFLPGDPILFVSGVIIANMSVEQPVLTLVYWMVLISTAAIVGNFVGYWCGKYFGHRLLKMKDNWLYKKEYIYRAQEFYEKQGGGAIIIARFLPMVRTFAPIVAGIVGMNFKRFALYNIVGGLIWVVSLMTLGFLLGENLWVQKNLEYVIMGIVVLATAPVLIKLIKGKKKPVEIPAKPEKELQEF